MDNNSIIFIILIVLVGFFILREIFCWYWKINESISLLEKMATLQTETAKLQAEIGNLLVNIYTESQQSNKLLQELILKSEKNSLTNSPSVIPTVVEESL